MRKLQSFRCRYLTVSFEVWQVGNDFKFIVPDEPPALIELEVPLVALKMERRLEKDLDTPQV